MNSVIAQVIPVPNLEGVVDTTNVSPWDPLWAFIVLVVGIVLARIARAFARRYATQAGLPPNIIDLMGTITMWTLVTVTIVFSLTFLGLDVAPLWLLLLFFLVAFVIGGRSLLESFGAGVLLQVRAPFEAGDLIRIEDDFGTVVEVNSRVVVIDSVDGRRIYLPNSTVLSSAIENLTHLEMRMSWLFLDVEYGTDLDKAIEVALRSAADVEEVLEIPQPHVQVQGFESSAIRLVYRFWHRSLLPTEWAAVDAAARGVYRAFRENGIVFAFPQTTLWWGDDDGPPKNPPPGTNGPS